MKPLAFKQRKVPIVTLGRGERLITAVAEVGMFWVTKTLPGTVRGTKGSWRKTHGYRLTVKSGGLALGWFPSVEVAMLAADQFQESCPQLSQELVTWDVEKDGCRLEASHPERLVAKALVEAWVGTYGDPLHVG